MKNDIDEGFKETNRKDQRKIIGGLICIYHILKN